MPNDVSGFTGQEIVTYVMSFIGSQESAFQTFLEQTLPLAEFRFCKAHDWSFLNKTNLSLTVVSGTAEYDLSVANIGYYMAANDVRNIYSVTNGVYLKKTTVEQLRRGDPANDDGTSTSQLSHWAPVSDNKILIYPANAFADTTLKIDGKVSPVALSTLTNYPTIPYRFQESFINYIIGVALYRENDDRADAWKSMNIQAISQDIRSDMESVGGGADEPRMKHMNEAVFEGISGNLESLYNAWVFNH